MKKRGKGFIRSFFSKATHKVPRKEGVKDEENFVVFSGADDFVSVGDNDSSGFDR